MHVGFFLGGGGGFRVSARVASGAAWLPPLHKLAQPSGWVGGAALIKENPHCEGRPGWEGQA